MARAGWTLRTLLLARGAGVARDHKMAGGRVARRAAAGSDLVDWLLGLSSQVHSRSQAVGMWQALLEEGVIAHGEIITTLHICLLILHSLGV